MFLYINKLTFSNIMSNICIRPNINSLKLTNKNTKAKMLKLLLMEIKMMILIL